MEHPYSFLFFFFSFLFQGNKFVCHKRVGQGLETYDQDQVDSFILDIYSFKGLAAMTQLDSSFKKPKHV